MDTEIAQMNICDYISYLRDQKRLASQSVAAYVSAIRKFYVMNDVQLNWEKIHSFKGEEEKRAEDRPYTHSEIMTMLQKTTPSLAFSVTYSLARIFSTFLTVS